MEMEEDLCFVCMEPGAPVSRCECNLRAHDECLLKWLAHKEPICSVCKAPYAHLRLVRKRSLSCPCISAVLSSVWFLLFFSSGILLLYQYGSQTPKSTMLAPGLVMLSASFVGILIFILNVERIRVQGCFHVEGTVVHC